MSFILLIITILLCIVLLAAMFWWGINALWAHPATTPANEPAWLQAEHHRPKARTTRLALSFSTLLALGLYLLIGSPYIVLFHSNDGQLGEQEIADNIVVLERFIDNRYGPDQTRQTDEFARAQYQLAEYLIVVGQYALASEKFQQLYELWPQETNLQQHYLLALSFASIQANVQDQPERATQLREKIKTLVDKHPHLRKEVRDFFSQYLQNAQAQSGDTGAALMPDPEQNKNDRLPNRDPGEIRLKIVYPDEKHIAPEAILFVSAHDTRPGAPKMPVAAKKYTDRPFPSHILLSSENMLSSGDLSEYPELEIRVRISQSGTLEDRKNDMISTTIVRTDLAVDFWPMRFTIKLGSDSPKK